MGRAETGTGAGALTMGVIEAARCACDDTDEFTARPEAVALAGAMMVTFVTFVTLVTFVTFRLFTTVLLFVMCMPTLTTGGALVTTAGGVPIGAGTIMPGREPGGGGTNTP